MQNRIIIYVLVNGRTRAVCGVFSTNRLAIEYAENFKIDSWHIIERALDAAPVQIA
jgi:hypothetical protein